jgi:hypothetical protein
MPRFLGGKAGAKPLYIQEGGNRGSYVFVKWRLSALLVIVNNPDI